MVTEESISILRTARSRLASDIYFIPYEDAYHLYMRVNNERQFIRSMHDLKTSALINHFKFVAGMITGEKRRSQSGSCDYQIGEETISIRLSTVGDYRGKESLVIRLLYDGVIDTDYWFHDFDRVAKNITQRGLYLFSGPVGSGKTTLMYQLANTLFSNSQIMTIEDPVEIKQGHMLQLQINHQIGMTYDELIKLSLRHRPDVLIIGEIRDLQTAKAAIRASLTGITVLSSIHANSISGVYDRLLDLGIEQSDLDAVVKGITYQRLISGKGVIDFAETAFQNWQNDNWNQKMDQLFESGYLTVDQKEREKISSGQTG